MRTRSVPGRHGMAIARQLGKYHLVKLLGRGGMGAVFEAEDTVLQRRVALKVLPPRMAANQDALQRFLREAQAAARLSHPNVVTIHEVGCSEKTHFIAMELVRGESAEQRLTRGPLDWPQATRIVADVCRGLHAAHRAGLVHRDVKPSNILLGEDGQVKLADFGLVKPADPQLARLTRDQTILGTPQYMSPEQCRGERVTRLADLYSLGATYFCLLTGRPPYRGDQPLSVMMAHCTDAVPDPRTLVPNLPESCAAVVQRAMAKEPADRYSGADELLSTLESMLDRTRTANVSPVLVPASMITIVDAQPVVQNRRWMRRGMWVGLVGLTAVLLLLALWRPTSTPRSAPEPRWTPLFNGRDLTNLFVSPESSAWTVQNGLLVGRGDLTYCFTRRDDFANFHCRVQMKLNARGNSGVCFRSIPGDRPPRGYEAQLGWSTTAGTPEFGGFFRSPTLPNTNSGLRSVPCEIAPDAWFEVEVIARGTQIEVKLDGVTVTEFVETNPFQTHGHLGLQSGSKETVVVVRRFDVRELP